eukprot:SAG31_NODE_1380_length_8582_cov_4.390192_4_plen_44_part_00
MPLCTAESRRDRTQCQLKRVRAYASVLERTGLPPVILPTVLGR